LKDALPGAAWDGEAASAGGKTTEQNANNANHTETGRVAFAFKGHPFGLATAL